VRARAGRAYGRPFIVCNYRKEILDTYRLRAGEVLDRGLVDRDQLCADCWRSDDAPMQHARQVEIVHIGKTACAFCGNIRPRKGLAD
jgi:hypothetical protein